MRTKDCLTTGEIAKLCKVAPRTVSKWIDTGELRGYRIPGSLDRRVSVRQLLKLIARYHMPFPEGLLVENPIVIGSQHDVIPDQLDRATADHTTVHVFHAKSLFEFGRMVERHKPTIVIVGASVLCGRLYDLGMELNELDYPPLRSLFLRDTDTATLSVSLEECGFDEEIRPTMADSVLLPRVFGRLAAAARVSTHSSQPVES